MESRPDRDEARALLAPPPAPGRRGRPGLRGVWLLVLVGWLVLGALAVWLADREYGQAVAAREAALHEATREAVAARQAELARIARIVAGDREVREILTRARAMVALEGGAGGGEESARLREELGETVRPIRRELIEGQDRVMQFHLGPECISFLRLHEPERFGDELAGVRPLLAHVYRSGQGGIGFEIGRVFSGFRAAEPVREPGGSGKVVGTVEVGTGIAPIDAHLREGSDARAALLLPARLAESHIWDEMRAEREIVPVGSGDYYRDGPAVEHPGLSARLATIGADSAAAETFLADGRHWLAVSLDVPVFDEASADALLVAVESVEDLRAAFHERLGQIAVAVALVILLTTLALWLLSRSQRTRWMVVVDRAEQERDALFQLSPQPVELTDARGQSLLVNDAFRRVFGEQTDDPAAGGAPAWQKRGIEGLQLESLERAIARGERWNGALRLKALLGGQAWYRVQVVPIADAGGRTAWLWWFYQDVDRERRAAALAQAERDRLDALLSGSPAVIYTYTAADPDRIEYVSANIREILGHAPDALIDGPGWWAETLHPDDRERVLAEADFTRWAGDRKHTRYRLMRPDGGAVWVTDTARLLRDDEGHAERVVGALIDSTEAVALESRLAESEHIYRSIVEGVEEAIFLVRVEPDGGFRYAAANPAHEQATGLSPDLLAGHTPPQVFGSRVAAILESRYRDCIEQGNRLRYTEVLDLPVGRRPVRTTLTPVRDRQGRVVLLVGMAVVGAGEAENDGDEREPGGESEE
ncbi:MAG: PAS domain-containing protein [Pseudomonadota bacterium]